MHRLLALSLLLCPFTANAADAIVHLDTPAQTLYVRVFTGSTTAVAAALTEGTSSGVGRYAVADSTLVSAGLSSAGVYPFKVFVGDADVDDDDPLVGVGTLYWSGSAALPAQVNVTHYGGEAATTSGGLPTVLISTGTGAGQINLSNGDVPLSAGALSAVGDSARDSILGATLGSYTTAGTLGEALNWQKAAFAESGVLSEAALVNAPDSIDEQQVRDAIGLAEANLDEQLSGVTAGVTEPRVNFEPDPGFTFQISRRSDNTYKCTRALRLVAGAVETVHPAIDMTPLFARSNPVKTVGTPTISGGGITVEAEGPRDSYAMLKVSGTATAGERRTITVLVTMRSNAVVKVELDVEVLQ